VTERALRGESGAASPPSGQTAAHDIALDQRFARILVRPLARTPITPNQITLISLVGGLGAAWLFALGGHWVHWGAGVFVLAAWLDHFDGELARLTGRTSEFGHYFDHVAALVNYCALFVGMGIGIEGSWLDPWAVPAGIVAGLAVATIFSTRLWVEWRDGRAAIRQSVRSGFEIEDTLYVVAPITWFGFLEPFLAAAAIGAPIFLIWVVYDAFVLKPRKARKTPS
jgi:phosphatidylglycerophosphate synthase